VYNMCFLIQIVIRVRMAIFLILESGKDWGFDREESDFSRNDEEQTMLKMNRLKCDERLKDSERFFRIKKYLKVNSN
jgi:hypothetical protein